MSKHTPGPWGFYEASLVTLWNEDAYAFAITKNYHEGIGVYVRCDNDYEERHGYGVAEANAQLIAAAPDLLNELRQCAELLREYTERYSPIIGTFTRIEKAQAAIEKATGLADAN